MNAPATQCAQGDGCRFDRPLPRRNTPWEGLITTHRYWPRERPVVRIRKLWSFEMIAYWECEMRIRDRGKASGITARIEADVEQFIEAASEAEPQQEHGD